MRLKRRWPQLSLRETSRTTSKASKSANDPNVTGWYILSHVEEVKPIKIQTRGQSNTALLTAWEISLPVLSHLTTICQILLIAIVNERRNNVVYVLMAAKPNMQWANLFVLAFARAQLACVFLIWIQESLSWIWPLGAKYVHVKCLQKWRNTSSSRSAFFSCPQCRYQYRFARTKIVGLASNTGDSFILQQIYRRH